MRIIGIGLLAILLAAAALALSYTDSLGASWNSLTGKDRVVFKSQDNLPSAVTGQNVVISPVALATPPILSGLPSYQGLSFLMPVDARAVGGYLQIDFSSQVLSGVEGALRVSINGVKRGEILLARGRNQDEIRIELNPSELAADHLDVSASLQGEGSAEECGPREAVEAIVEIQPTSGLRLRLDSPMESARDRVIAWGNQARVGWDDSLPEMEKMQRLIYLARVENKGWNGRLVDGTLAGGMTAAMLGDLEKSLPLNSVGEPFNVQRNTGYPLSLTAQDTNKGARRFYHGTTWRHEFDQRSLPGGQIPSALNLDLALTPLPAGSDWTISTTLNGRLVDVARSSGSAEKYTSRVALQADLFRHDNQIEIKAVSGYDPETICALGPELIAELNPETTLVGPGSPFNDGVEELRQQLAAAVTVKLGSLQGLSANDASQAKDLLAALNPSKLAFYASKGRAEIRVSNVSDLASQIPSAAPGNRWLVWSDTNSPAGYRARQITAAGSLPLAKNNAIALLVSFPAG